MNKIGIILGRTISKYVSIDDLAELSKELGWDLKEDVKMFFDKVPVKGKGILPKTKRHFKNGLDAEFENMKGGDVVYLAQMISASLRTQQGVQNVKKNF